LFPARELVTSIVSPILDELEEHRTHEDFGIAHQHLAAGLLRNMVGSLFRLHPPSANADTMVLATLASDRHEFGTLLAALLAATHGWRVVSLGPDVPAAEIALAVRLTNAGVLALSLRTGQPGINEELASVSRLAPASTRIWIVGVDASQHGQLMQRDWLLMRNLQELDEQLGK